MKNILVTGGAGFIGSHLVERLLSLRAVGEAISAVTCVDNFDPFYDSAIKERNIAAAQKDPRFHLVRVDICDRPALEKVFQLARPDVVVHLAARAGVRPSIKNPVAYHQTNVEGTLNVLECARNAGTSKIVFGSSSSVYGVSSRLPFSESDPLYCPISPYAATKIAAESLCKVFHGLYGISMVILRFFTVYGPRQRPEMAIAKFTRSIVDGKTIDLYGDGTSLRDYTYVDDIVNGIMAAIRKPLDCEVINIGNAHAVPLKDLIATIEARAKVKAKICWLPDQSGDVPVTYANVSRARRLLGYKPKVKIEDGIQRYLEWTRSTSPGPSLQRRGRS